MAGSIFPHKVDIGTKSLTPALHHGEFNRALPRRPLRIHLLDHRRRENIKPAANTEGFVHLGFEDRSVIAFFLRWGGGHGGNHDGKQNCGLESFESKVR